MAVWSHHMYVTGGVTNQYFAFTSTALLVPAGIEYFDMVGTLIGGSIVLRTSMLFALTFFIQFLIGGLSGIFVASPVLDYQAYGTVHRRRALPLHAVRREHLRLLRRRLPLVPEDHRRAAARTSRASCSCVLMVIGTNMTFFPMFFLGNDGMPRRVSRYPTHPGWGTLNEIETIGAGIIALGVLTFLINVFVSLRRRVPAGDDPWLGHTLEWATTSPPPPLNFERPLPPIRSYAPLLDLREDEMDRARRHAEVTAG